MYEPPFNKHGIMELLILLVVYNLCSATLFFTPLDLVLVPQYPDTSYYNKHARILSNYSYEVKI